jgi:hypothetical protein
MQTESVQKAEQTSTKASDDMTDVSPSLSSSNHIENPEKALLNLFRESTESRQAFIIQIYFYGGIAIVTLCAAIFLMMYLV